MAITKQEVNFIVDQIRHIILNKPLPVNPIETGEHLSDVQEAIAYLSNCLTESNEFLKNVGEGKLNVPPPDRKNFLAGNLKELHAGLKHLTWQANQVAQGDYNQQVRFLGEFSVSFNKMILQLKDREQRLKKQSQALSQNIILMQSIMDGMKEWVVVTSQENIEIIYYNQSAKQKFFNETATKNVQKENRLLLNNCIENKDNCDTFFERDYFHTPTNHTFRITTFSLEWNDMLAFVNRIVDVTDEITEQTYIQELAYKDELTGLYNRRYCIEKLEAYLAQNTPFSFCMIDIDKLKYANDTYGHAAGDEYLHTVAQELLNCTRSSDIVCRLGGDEFAIIFLNCKSDLVSLKLEAINDKFKSEKNRYPMSFSYGTVTAKPDSTIDIKKLISMADSKMYEYKQASKAHQP